MWNNCAQLLCINNIALAWHGAIEDASSWASPQLENICWVSHSTRIWRSIATSPKSSAVVATTRENLRHIRPLIDLPTARMSRKGWTRGDVTAWLPQQSAVWNIHKKRLIVCRSLRIHWLEPCVRLLSHQAPRTCVDRFIGCQWNREIAVVTFKAPSTGVPAYLASLVDNFPNRSPLLRALNFFQLFHQNFAV